MSLQCGFGIYFRTEKQKERAKEQEQKLSKAEKKFLDRMLGLILEVVHVSVVSEETIPIIIQRLDFLDKNGKSITKQPLNTEHLKPFIGVHCNVEPEGTTDWLLKHAEPRLTLVTSGELYLMATRHIEKEFLK